MQRKERDTSVAGNMANVHNQDSGHCFSKNGVSLRERQGQIYYGLHLYPSDLPGG